MKQITEKVGSIVVATGVETYDPRVNDEYGYTRFENVLTSLEFERLINAGGPTKGEVDPAYGSASVPNPSALSSAWGPRSVRKGGSLLLQRLLHEHHQKHPDAQGELSGNRSQGVLYRYPGLWQRV